MQKKQLYGISKATWPLLHLMFWNLCVNFVCVASAGGGPVADGGGVRPGSDAEEAGVPQQWGPEAACPADGSGRPAVQRTLPGPGEEGRSLGVMQKFMRYCHILDKTLEKLTK